MMLADPTATPSLETLGAFPEGTGPLTPVADWRREGASRFAVLGLPTRRLEGWRYTDLAALRATTFRAAGEDDLRRFEGALPLLGDDHPERLRLVFVNGLLHPALSRLHAPVPGVNVTSLAAAGDLAEDLRSRLGREAAADDDDQPMPALNAALMRDGALIHVGRGIDVARPIELVFIGGVGDGPVGYHPRHLIVLEPGSSASLIETHTGGGADRYLANHVTRIVVGESARLRHYLLQSEGTDGYHIATRHAAIAAGARYEAFALTLGGRLTRNEITVTLDGAKAESVLAGAYLLRGKEHCDNTLVSEHRVPHTACRQVFKGVLDDSARGVFQGRIVVHRDAQHSDGHQLSKALLLSDAAEIDQKPELEIYADDVKCSHGAAAGQLDADELFYLRARGIPEGQARRLLIEGFLAEVFDEIAEPDLHAAFTARANAWFGDGGEAGR